MSDVCPCGGYTQQDRQLKFYTECCEPLHTGKKKAETPEQLMRSRFSAFYLENADYLMQTLHRSQHAHHSIAELEQSFKQTRWLSLKIIRTTETTVEFTAFCIDPQQAIDAESVRQMHEVSRFVFEEGAWFYIDGKHLPPIKLGRNDNCWCGSGKKLKKCHA